MAGDAVIPHLIHIGYPKTGSNFLRRWFAAHPQIAFRDGGLAGFENVWAMAAEAAAPPGEVRCRVTSAEALATPHGSAGASRVEYLTIRETPIAAVQAEACRLLRGIFPTAQVLIVTRGFRAMLVSSYSQYVRTGGVRSLEDFCRATPVNPAGEAWNYDRLIALYEAAFGAGAVLVLPYELLRDDPPAFVAAIGSRLGLDAFGPPVEARVNPRVSEAALAWYPRLARGSARSPLLAKAYARLLGRGRLERAVRVLQRIRPQAPPGAQDIPTETLAACRGFAGRLRESPWHRPYLSEYLWPEDPRSSTSGEKAG